MPKIIALFQLAVNTFFEKVAQLKTFYEMKPHLQACKTKYTRVNIPHGQYYELRKYLDEYH